MEKKDKKGSTKVLPNDDKDAPKKKIRKRQRHIYNSVREQMEFYFGDSNLQKDRFMKQLIEKEAYVPLEVFLTFNKIKSLTDSIDMIAMAISSSELLELDETKKKVKRKTVFNPDENVDDRTLYVEALPTNVDHEWMKSMFKRYGKITYVSLPKYAKSRKPKDFGFVEFQKEKSINKAIIAFKTFNGVLSCTEPAQLASIKAHNAEESEKKETEKKAIKRPLTPVEDVKCKKPKLEDSNGSDEKKTLPVSSSDSSSTDDSDDADMKENSEKVQKKRRKHKNSAEKRKKQLELTTDASFYELKILPKREWKKLRNRYLNLQREKTSELKRKTARDKESQQQLAKGNATANSTSEVSPQMPAKKSKHEERRMHKMKMNFYGAGADAELPVRQASVSKTNKMNAGSQVTVKFEHGLIVKTSFDKPCVDIKEFKAEMRTNKTVKYVDITEGAAIGYVRFETPVEAENFVKKYQNRDERKYSILQGEAEIAYFDKIERDRQMKLNKEIKIPTKRGREKIKAALAKHTWFNDDEAEQNV